MDHRAYSERSLLVAIGALEQRYGMSSRDFLQGHRTDHLCVSHIPGYERHVWASFYLESMESDDFSASVEKTLEIA